MDANSDHPGRGRAPPTKGRAAATKEEDVIRPRHMGVGAGSEPGGRRPSRTGRTTFPHGAPTATNCTGSLRRPPKIAVRSGKPAKMKTRRNASSRRSRLRTRTPRAKSRGTGGGDVDAAAGGGGGAAADANVSGAAVDRDEGAVAGGGETRQRTQTKVPRHERAGESAPSPSQEKPPPSSAQVYDRPRREVAGGGFSSLSK